MKRLYDVTFTIAMGEKAHSKLVEQEERALERDENLPLWCVGLDCVGILRADYGIKAHLVEWHFARNVKDLAKENAP